MIDNLLEQIWNKNQIVKFAIVGIIGLSIENSILYIVVDYIGPTAGKLLSAEISIIVMFFLNENWTYSKSPGHVIKRFFRSNIVRSGGVIIATATFLTLYNAGIPLLLSNTIGIGAGFSANYIFETLYTWGNLRAPIK